ncbi:MAG: hypothetical protein A2381_18490 [Bdellovibrionales bacterium RIFOXYB1_FULL_37_110]|nr:MAG: hypothetical protein A2417_01280 [Bdellovibrionales bacterium RIFOXYC1_FULL_37_79]OFZ59019.1 MAG: hypothetical protein A2381_18490 [Bdellovibrionales bacterium RIFOXYB1_FULL_37_110]OFZ65124.1 MAG: hypothetical protein A2577_04805 [Bdellovibrionales bacterium RIFOXYD1_FULL_36_51]
MKKIILLFALFTFVTYQANSEPVLTGEAMFDYAHLSKTQISDEDDLIRSRPSVMANFSRSLGQGKERLSPFSIEGSFYGYANFKEGETGKSEFRKLILNYKGDHNVFNLGMQSISWSETFGVNIMDVVNPRDYSFYVFDDLNMSKIPVSIINYQYFYNDFSFQLIYNPEAKFDRLPGHGSLFDPYAKYNLPLEQTPSPKAFSDSEFGGRVRYLFSGGLDLGFIYYSHFNRNPAIYLDPALNKLHSHFEKVNSFGETFSLVVGELVLRGDYLYTPDTPYATNDLSFRYSDRHQAILGGDYSTANGFSFGVQLHMDTLFDHQWISAQLKNSFMGETFRPSLMIFSGLDNQDLWARAEFSYFYTSSFQIAPQYNYLAGKSGEGIFGEFTDKDYYQLMVKYLF